MCLFSLKWGVVVRLLLLGLSLGWVGGRASAREALDKPNVIVVFLDDAGYADFAHTGNPTIRTPNLSRMVAEGLNFPEFYSGSPVCSASRYSMLTGRNPIRSGFGTPVLRLNTRTYLHPREVTIADGLKARGYATAIFGKWHLGNPNAENGMTPDALPLAHGFDQWLGTNLSHDFRPGATLIRSAPGGTSPVAGYEVLESEVMTKPEVFESLTQRYTAALLDFITAKKDQPFFAYFALNMPHLPVAASPAFKGRSHRGPYGDCIEEIDDSLGRIRAALEQAGIAKNTLVIFSSDNGPWILFQNTADSPHFGEARLLVGSAYPFRDGKGSTWEGGQRVPGVFWWPGTIRPGAVAAAPASTLDVLPSVFALAGEPLPQDRTIDGRDLRPYFNPELFNGSVPPFVFYYSGFEDNSIGAVRRGPWKLHTKIFSQTKDDYGFTASEDRPLLFNVEQDPSERFDRAAGQGAEVGELKGLLDAFNAKVKAEGAFWDPVR